MLTIPRFLHHSVDAVAITHGVHYAALMPPNRSRTDWWIPTEVNTVMDKELEAWKSDGTLSPFGQILNRAAQELAEIAIKRHRLDDKEADHARQLAMLAVLDSLSTWALAVTQDYVMKSLRPNGITWPSIAAATNRGVDSSKIRFDKAQGAKRVNTAQRRKEASEGIPASSHENGLGVTRDDTDELGR